MAKANFPEKFGTGESLIEKLGTEIEGLKDNTEKLRVVKTKPKAIKRSKHRNATALAASSIVFNQAVLELQGLSFITLDIPSYELFLRKILSMY